MNATRQEKYGWALAACGAFMAVFSHGIVFTGLKRLFGLEALVGVDSLLQTAGGSAVYNPATTLAKWVAATAALGLLVAAAGVLLVLRVRADLRMRLGRFAATTPFTLTATLSVVHAAAPIIFMAVLSFAQRVGWMSPMSMGGAGSNLWICSVLTWPLWYVVVPLANRSRGLSPVIPLILGTVVWGFSALQVAGLFLFLLLWRGC